MKVFIAPGMLQYLTDAEVEWIESSAGDNLSALRDAVGFVNSHPEAVVDMQIGKNNGQEYRIEVYEQDADDYDIHQLVGDVDRTQYSADIVRIECEARAFVGRVYL